MPLWRPYTSLRGRELRLESLKGSGAESSSESSKVREWESMEQDISSVSSSSESESDKVEAHGVKAGPELGLGTEMTSPRNALDTISTGGGERSKTPRAPRLAAQQA